METQALNTPILFLIFNRPDTAEQVFEVIRRVRPTRLFVAGDGARPSKTGEKELCDQARAIIKKIDWPCQVETRFLEHNEGCKAAVSGAVDWFFSQVEEGIILEDDCVPEISFFSFCEKMLKRYRLDTRIMMVCGTNYLFGKKLCVESYFFSRYYACWGWATWKRAWQKYDGVMPRWPEQKKNNALATIFLDHRVVNFYTNLFDAVYNKTLNSWAIPWDYSCIFNNGLAVVPAVNLVKNIGSEGTHTGNTASVFNAMPTGALDTQNLIHPKLVAPHERCDNATYAIIVYPKKTWRARLSLLTQYLGLYPFFKKIQKKCVPYVRKV